MKNPGTCTLGTHLSRRNFTRCIRTLARNYNQIKFVQFILPRALLSNSFFTGLELLTLQSGTMSMIRECEIGGEYLIGGKYLISPPLGGELFSIKRVRYTLNYYRLRINNIS